MKILYLSQRFDFETAGVYADLVIELIKNNHEVTILTCDYKKKTVYRSIVTANSIKIIYTKVPNQFVKSKLIKGLTQLILPFLMIRTYNKVLKGKEFDLILHPTPPISFYYLVKHIKKNVKGIKSYLMLKDIFPQNGVDLDYFKKNSLVYKYYRSIEKKLYGISDRIGCMSIGNKNYVIDNNKQLNRSKIEVFPNTMKKYEYSFSHSKDEKIRFLIGGNLSLPQDIPYLMDCLLEVKYLTNIEFLIAGTGTYSKYIHDFIEENKLVNVVYLGELDRNEYEELVKKCHIGVISLNYKFTIPNIPARFLSYISKGLPVLLISDVITDLKSIVLYDAKCGFWSPSNDVSKFQREILKICSTDLVTLSKNAYSFFNDNYQVKYSVEILERFYREEIK